MKIILSCLIFLTMITNPIDKYKWKNRLILIFAESETEMTDQVNILNKEKKGLKDRDLLIFTIGKEKATDPQGNSLSPQQQEWLSKEFNPGRKPFAVVLIGKDGTEKLTEYALLSTDKLFSTIDVMPMRQQEMKDDYRK
ncbi:DUF4174 domain-containing protein [Fulvivirga sp. RKSG066]|uniref:DUF4174 domain-containing protein n=1 Tax=Fulvivirga aurantia TaxID=2529383 RepID=UPI0012BD37B8|nr:DUF4174 domain-containing protein [Fulvivirga aurantia]MTI23246.1 DUF4174 domain-containing protein [Fulvivirga aurantia]